MAVTWADRADMQGLCWSKLRRKRQQPHREGSSGGRMHSILTVQDRKPLTGELHGSPPRNPVPATLGFLLWQR